MATAPSALRRPTVECHPYLAAAARAAITLLAGVDRRQAPRRSAELDSLGKPGRRTAATLHADERFVGRYRLDRVKMQMAPRAAQVTVVAGLAAGEAHVAPAMRRQAPVDIARHGRVAGRAIDRERQAECRQLAKGPER